MRFRLKHLGFFLLAALLIMLTLAGAAVYWATPTVIIRNDTSTIVQVTARWGDRHRTLEGIEPGSERTFKVRGESSITFIVTYPNGSRVGSSPVYFTSTMTVTAVITDRSVQALGTFNQLL
jgi:hypothetical protein